MGKLRTSSDYVESNNGKLVIPRQYVQRRKHANTDNPFSDPLVHGSRQGRVTHGKQGTKLQRCPDTGVIQTPAYGSNMDDLLNRAIVGGYIENVGYTGVVDPMLSSLVTKLSNMAGTWRPQVTGRRLARRRAIDVISRANDSSFGSGEFARQIAAGYFIDNAGVAFAKLPIYSLPFNLWAEKGLRAVPLEPEEENPRSNNSPDYYYLQASPRQLRRNSILEAIDVLTIWPTGVAEWPFWILKEAEDEESGQTKMVWVLIHRSVGGHITVTSGPRTNTYIGKGQSGTWRYLSFLVEDVLVKEERIESFMFQPPQGIVWLTGADYPRQLMDALVEHQKDREEGEIMYYTGVLFGGSENDNAKILNLKFRNRPEGFTDRDWMDYKEDILTQSFWASLTQITNRAGRGMATQATIGVDAQSEALFAAIKQMMESIYTWATEDVVVRQTWKSDRSLRMQVETQQVLQTAIKAAQDAGAGLTFTTDEIRAIFEQHGGMDIPTMASANDADTMVLGEQASDVLVLDTIRKSRLTNREVRQLPAATTVNAGDIVCLEDGEMFIVTETTGVLTWLKDIFKSVILVRTNRLRVVQEYEFDSLANMRQALGWFVASRAGEDTFKDVFVGTDDIERRNAARLAVDSSVNQALLFSDIDPATLGLYAVLLKSLIDRTPVN